MGEGGPMSKIVETGLIEKKETKITKTVPTKKNENKEEDSIFKTDYATHFVNKEMEPLRLKTVQSKYLDLVFTYNVNEDVPEREGEPGHNMDQPKLSFRKRIPLKKKYNSIWDNSTPTPEPVDPPKSVDCPEPALDYFDMPIFKPADPSESIDFSESALNCSTLTCEPADSSEPALGYLNISTFRPVDPPESVDPIPLTTNRVLINYPTTKLHEDSKT